MFIQRFFQRTRHFIRLALVVYWGALLLGTHLPAQHVPHHLDPVDKFVHLTAYAGLSFLFLAAFPGTVLEPTGRMGWIGTIGVALLMAIHGALDEVTQALIPGRFPSALDWFADCIGTVMGLGAFATLLVMTRYGSWELQQRRV